MGVEHSADTLEIRHPLSFYVADADFLKKLRVDCNKANDDAPLKSVGALLVSVETELRKYFPALESATGTLSINISLTGIMFHLVIH